MPAEHHNHTEEPDDEGASDAAKLREKLSPLEFQRVVSEPEAASIIGVSLPQLRRMRRQRAGPDYVQLSERRLGYRISALIKFLDDRTVVNADEAVD
jgi:predicted DNA-binding transcriptional regulator AlpA